MEAVQGSLFSSSELGESVPPERAYRGTVASKVSGITYRQLDYWDKKHIVSPSLHASHGSGSRRLYSAKDIILLLVLKRLLDAGVILQNAALVIAQLRQEPIDEIQSLTIISDGRKVRLCTDDQSILDLLKGGRAIFGLSLNMIYTTVFTRLEYEKYVDLSEEIISDRTGRVIEHLPKNRPLSEFDTLLAVASNGPHAMAFD